MSSIAKAVRTGCLAKVKTMAGLAVSEERDEQYYSLRIPEYEIVLCTKAEALGDGSNFDYSFLWGNKVYLMTSTCVDPRWLAEHYLEVLT